VEIATLVSLINAFKEVLRTKDILINIEQASLAESV